MFEKLIGNNSVKNILNHNIISKNILHSYLFIGEEGIGKTLFAREFAKAILCANELEYCNSCKSCLEMENGNHPDFMQVESDGKSIKIEQIRMIQQKIAEKPVMSDKKVYIIKDADNMTGESQNCLLKTLEEPPEYAVIILVASNETKLLNTIKSRCIKIPFQRIENEKIEEYLKNTISENLTENMVAMCEGSIGKANRLEQMQDSYRQIEIIINKINQVDLIEILNTSQVLYEAEDKIKDLLEYMNIVLYNKRYITAIAIVEEAKKRLEGNSNYAMTIDYLLIKIWEEIN